MFDNLESFGVGLTSFALDANVTWPFVLYPDFQVKGILSNEATGSHTLTLNPIVYPQDIETWSKWSVANSGWMETAHERDKTVHEELYELEYHETDVYHDESLRWNVTGITPFVWKESNNSDGSVSRVPVGQAKYYAPMWLNSPACDYSPLVNNDLRSWSHFEEYVDALVDLDHAVLTEVVDATYLRTNYDSRFDPAEQEEPHSYLLVSFYSWEMYHMCC